MENKKAVIAKSLSLIFQGIKDLQNLSEEDGVEFEVNGKKETFFGTVTAIVGDNLSSHLVGGFKAAFSNGYRKCRTCLGLYEDIQTKFSDCDFIMRTRQDHDAQCSDLRVQ